MAVNFKNSIAPWLSVRASAKAVEFYKTAFGATEVYRHEGDAGSVVSRLAVGEGAEFWVGDESPEHRNFSPQSLNGATARIILTVADPYAIFASAINAGATEVWPVSEGHGWRVGCVLDPYGHHWEIGRPLAA